MRNYNKAISDFLKTISLNPENSSSDDDLGYMDLEKKDYQNAAANFKKGISLDGKNFDAMLGIAIANCNLENLEQAKGSILQAITVEPRLAEGMAGIEKDDPMADDRLGGGGDLSGRPLRLPRSSNQ